MLTKDIVTHEAEHFLIINKPAGVSVHGGEKVSGETIADFLATLYPELKTVGDAPHFRPGIVHRLDKDTSGVMIVARTNDGYEELKKAFMERRVEKRYIVLACGIIKKDFWEMKSIIGRSTKRYTKQASLPLDEDDEVVDRALKNAKEALTEFEVLERLQNRFTLLYAYPKTGRMHQIRVQLASFGFPVACDGLYGKRHGTCPRNLGRIFLHAESVRFKLFGAEYAFAAPLPSQLDEFLKKIRVNAVIAKK